MSGQRKPPTVASISGSYQDDEIKQEELRALSESQAAEWLAAKKTHKLALDIEARLMDGAKVERGPLMFDRELGMARSMTEARRRKTG